MELNVIEANFRLANDDDNIFRSILIAIECLVNIQMDYWDKLTNKYQAHIHTK